MQSVWLKDDETHSKRSNEMKTMMMMMKMPLQILTKLKTKLVRGKSDMIKKIMMMKLIRD